MIELIGNRLFNLDNYKIKKNDTELRIRRDIVDDNFYILIVNNNTRYVLGKVGIDLVWNLPPFIDNEDISISIECKLLGSDDILFLTNSVIVMRASLEYSFPIYNMNSDNPIVPIINKRILMPKNYEVIVEGDISSRMFTFENNRYDNDIDLSTKNIMIYYLNTIGEEYEVPIANLSLTTDLMRFSWILDENVTVRSGVVKFSIKINGLNEKNNPYSWQTLSSEFKVNKALSQEDFIQEAFPSIIQQNQRIISDLQNRIKLLESKFNF